MMLRGTRADNEMFRWEPNDTPTSSMSSEDQSRAFANRTITTNNTKKKCKPLLALKLILPFCILFLAVANVMPMHHPVMTQDIENLARKAEFFEKEAFNFRAGVNAGKINDENSGIGSNNRDFGSNEIRMQQFAQDLLVRQDQSRKNSSFAKVIFNLSNIDQYPSALHPITFPKCCPILSVPKSRHHPPCDTVCYTEQACNNELYPYSSKENRSFLSRRIVENKTDKLRIREPCNEMNSLRKPQYQWCQHWKIRSVSSIDTADHNVTNKKYSIDPYAAKLPPPGCSTLESGGGSGSYQHVILFPQAKLAFCGIPKSGLTRWLQFLRFTFGAKDYQGFPHMKPEVAAMRFDKLREQTQMEILNDPEWKFAAILRNPAERLLSAYLDKVASKKAGLRKSFQNTYGLNYTISFEEFVNYLGEERQSCPVSKKNEKIDGLRGVDWCANPHWRPQTFFCGLSEFLPRFSFIGSLDHVEHQSRALLQSVGLWESHGKYYHWVDDKKEMKGAGFCRVQPPELRNGQELIGFQQRMRQHFASNNETQNNATAATNNNTNEVVPDIIYGHSTDSRSKVDSYYSSPELLEKVHMLYEGDFKLWDLIKDKDSLSSGDELAAALSPECRILRESGNGHKEIFSDKKIRTEGFT